MSARTLAPTARRDLADDLAILRDYVSELDAALADRDRARAAAALATLAQTVHQVQLSVDPEGQTVAALTRCDGRYAYRPAAALDAVSAADPADTTVPDADALPTLVAVPRQAASVRDQDHPAVADVVDADRLREARRLLEHAERVKAADQAPPTAADGSVCSCTPLVGDRHARACELYDGWAE